MAYTRSSDGRSPARQAVNFLGVSLLAGVVLAGLTLPAAGALGLTAKNAAKGFDDLPGEFKRPPLSQASQILDSEGGLIATVYSRDRTVVHLDDIAPVMQQALVDIEDSRFFEHGAIDPKGILRALNKNAQDGTSEGASTLTQQYVKNVFVEQAGDDPEAVAQVTQQTVGRKIKELKYAIQVEKELSKKQILENYLNITFFGQQSYGIEAAAKRYFSKSAKDLNLTESAMLAGLVQSPTRYDPIINAGTATERRNTVLQRMAEVGDITQAAADAAKKKPLGLKVTSPKNGCITTVDGAGFFCDYVREVMLNDPTFGKSKEDRAKRWNEGGMTIRTTLKPQAQKAVQNSIQQHVYKSDSVATAVTIVEPGTGKILGMGQSRPYGVGENETQINLSVDKNMGGSEYGFQVGSTFKPIIAAAALERGVQPSKTYKTGYNVNLSDQTWSTCNGPLSTPWTVSNESRTESGQWTMSQALAKSINTYFALLGHDIGLCPISQLAAKMGVERGDDKPLEQTPASLLGAQTITPLTMANAYATFANRGSYCTPVAIESVTDADGKKLSVPHTKCSQVISQKTADTINTMLQGVVQDGTGQQAKLLDRATAGKTGTTDDRLAAWFVGYTPNMSAAVWVGGPTSNVSMKNITIGGVYHDKVYGADTPGPIWRDAMSGALAGYPAENFVTVQIEDPKRDKKDEGDQGKHHNQPSTKPSTHPNPTVSWPTWPTDGGQPTSTEGWPHH